MGTKNGPVIDDHVRILDWTNRPIPGLSAAGNTAAAPIGPAILSSGTTLGLGMTFGWLAGTPQHISTEDVSTTGQRHLA